MVKIGDNCDGKSSLATWWYIHHADQYSEITVNGTKYSFCEHYFCKFIGKQGLHNLMHISSNHKFPRKKPDDNNTTTSPTIASTITGASSISCLGTGSVTPRCTLGVVSPPLKTKTKIVSIPDDPIDPDPNGLEFVEALMADANPIDAASMTAAVRPPDIGLLTGAIFEDDDDSWFDAILDYDDECVMESTENFLVDDNVKSPHHP